MRTKFTRVVVGAATAVAFVGLFASTANAAAGELIVTPPTGVQSTAFTALPPSASKCPGDAVAGYRISSFVTPAANNPATLTYNADGPIGTNTYPLFDTNGSAFVGQNPGLGDGLIAGIPSFNWMVFAGTGLLPAGNYIIGIACTLTTAGVTNTVTFYSAAVTLGAEGATYSAVAVPPNVPEVPLNVLLPVSAAAILGAGFLVARKRQSHHVSV